MLSICSEHPERHECFSPTASMQDGARKQLHEKHATASNRPSYHYYLLCNHTAEAHPFPCPCECWDEDNKEGDRSLSRHLRLRGDGFAKGDRILVSISLEEFLALRLRRYPKAHAERALLLQAQLCSFRVLQLTCEAYNVERTYEANVPMKPHILEART